MEAPKRPHIACTVHIQNQRILCRVVHIKNTITNPVIIVYLPMYGTRSSPAQDEDISQAVIWDFAVPLKMDRMKEFDRIFQI